MEKASSILFSTICLEFQTMKAMNLQEIVCKPSKRDEEKQKPNAANLVNFFFWHPLRDFYLLLMKSYT